MLSNVSDQAIIGHCLFSPHPHSSLRTTTVLWAVEAKVFLALRSALSLFRATEAILQAVALGTVVATVVPCLAVAAAADEVAFAGDEVTAEGVIALLNESISVELEGYSRSGSTYIGASVAQL